MTSTTYSYSDRVIDCVDRGVLSSLAFVVGVNYLEWRSAFELHWILRPSISSQSCSTRRFAGARPMNRARLVSPEATCWPGTGEFTPQADMDG
jgi:hypothetical protein